MITVAGEALIDIVIDASGSVTAHPVGLRSTSRGRSRGSAATASSSGSCPTTASASTAGPPWRRPASDRGRQRHARPNHARDRKARRIRHRRVPVLPARDVRGATDRRGCSPEVLDGSNAIALGGLSLLIEPTASTLTALISQKPPGATIFLDPNCRPDVATDLDAYRDMIDVILRQVDLVKVSADDLRVLRPDSTSREAARGLLALGPAAVLVTDGPAPVTIHTPTEERSVPVPVVDVVDTIGARDAFVAAFLTWWTAHALTSTTLPTPTRSTEQPPPRSRSPRRTARCPAPTFRLTSAGPPYPVNPSCSPAERGKTTSPQLTVTGIITIARHTR